MNEYIKPRDAAKYFGVSLGTLRDWDKRGLIKCIRTKENGGQRRYDIRSFKNTNDRLLPAEIQTTTEEINKNKEYYCYCRVSSKKQKDDLERQAEYLQSLYPSYTVIKDIGSGLNFKRKGLLTILERANKGFVGEVVIAYKDRLCRYGFELLEWFFTLYKVKLTVLKTETISPDEELAKDILNIVHVFACRANGKRKYSKKKTVTETEEESKQSDEDT